MTWKLEGGAAAVNEAGRMRMQTYRLALILDSAQRPKAAELAATFDESIALLASGDPSRPLQVPWSPESQAGFAAVRAEWAGLKQRWLDEQRSSADLALDAERFVRQIDGFVAAIEMQIIRWTAVLNFFQLAMMALAIGSAVALMYAGYLLVLDPLARLRRGLAAVQAGDMATRVEVSSEDEFGELSAGFNEMAQTLQALYSGLEGKVREKTEGLEVKRKRLADLYEVSAFLAQSETLDAMSRGFAAKVRVIARADAAAVRWCDEGNQHYLMLAGENLPPEMADAESCLDTGRCDCGQPVSRATTRIIPIRSDAAVLGHCQRAGFRNIVSVPLRLHEKLVGEVDLFYREPVEPDPEDRELLEALAAHLASAMESLRAAALEREAAVAEERSLLARELHDSIAQSLAFLKIQVQLLRQAVQHADPDATGEAIDELDAGVRECYADVRELLVHFRTRTNEEDIEPALRTTLSKFEHQTGMKTRLEMDGHGVPLAPDVQVQVLHVVQEALSNVRKHARAHNVVLKVEAQPNWRFTVTDDGQGFDPESDAPGETHVGLRIMRERAARIGASVQVRTGRGLGCTVTLALPGTPAALPEPQQAVATP